MKKHHDSRLLQLTTLLLKYFLLSIFGLAIAYILSMGLGGQQIFVTVLPLVGNLFSRLAIILLCMITTTVILESLR